MADSDELQRLREDVERLSREVRFLDSVIDLLPHMVFIKDAEHLRFVRFNRMGEEMLGLSRSDMIGRSDHDFFPPDQADFFVEKDRQVLRSRVLHDIPEEPIERADGSTAVLHTRKIPLIGDDGEAAYLLGISEDITERKRNREELALRSRELAEANALLQSKERELRARTRQLEALLDQFPGALWTTRGNTVLSASGAHADLLGLVEGVDLAQLGEASLLAIQTAAIEGASGVFELYREGRTWEVRVEPFEDGAIAVALDVSERRRIEAEQLQSRLQRSQKMESLGILAGGIAHDFNNILQSILGHASLADLKLDDDHPVRTHIERIEASAERAAELTRQMLAYSGHGTYVVEPLDLGSLVVDMADLLQVSTPKNVRLVLDLDEGLPTVRADASQLRQLVMNLITNAADAVETRGGAIEVTTELVEVDAEELESTWFDEDLPPGVYVVLQVEDDGHGMDDTTLSHMFDPFFTTKTGGHGLGLAAALGIVRGHGGGITVESGDWGTRVRVLLPVSGEAASLPPATPVPVQKLVGRVLAVDDEPEVRRFLQETLSGAGLEVDVACDGVEALELYGQRRYDLVVLDLTMPRMGGAEAFEALRKRDPRVRVVMSSGYTDAADVSRLGSALRGFLQKPYRAGMLLDVVRSALGS